MIATKDPYIESAYIVRFVHIFTHQHISFPLTLYHFSLFSKSFLCCKQRGMYPYVIQDIKQTDEVLKYQEIIVFLPHKSVSIPHQYFP